VTIGGLLGRAVLGLVLLAGVALAMVDPITLGLYVPFASVGGYLIHRRPRNVIGWLLLGIGLTQIGTTTPTGFDVDGLAAGTASIRDQAHAWVGAWAGGAGFMLYAALAFTFPSGHLPTGPWHRVAVVALLVGTLVVALPAFFQSLIVSADLVTEVLVPNPLGFLPDPSPSAVPALQVVITAVPLVILAVSVVSLLVRYRRAQGIEALQMRWLLAAVAFVVVAVVFGLIGFVATDMTVGLVWIPALVAYPSVALAVGVAVMRYRLFEIDRVISRTIAYVLVTAVLFTVFAIVNLALQTTLGSLVAGNTLAVAVSTLVVAALFQPIRVRLQRGVDRRFNRSQRDHEVALEAFLVDLRDEVDVERLAEHMRRAVITTLEPRAIALWQRPRGSAS
jgi:hypothetical protein